MCWEKKQINQWIKHRVNRLNVYTGILHMIRVILNGENKNTLYVIGTTVSPFGKKTKQKSFSHFFHENISWLYQILLVKEMTA